MMHKKIKYKAHAMCISWLKSLPYSGAAMASCHTLDAATRQGSPLFGVEEDGEGRSLFWPERKNAFSTAYAGKEKIVQGQDDRDRTTDDGCSADNCSLLARDHGGRA